MNYFKEAFGVFLPHIDPYASMKFSLNVMMMDRRLKEIIPLLEEENQLEAIEGEPGWTIERKSGKNTENPSGAESLDGAQFRAYVDPNAFELKYPECFMSREDFTKILKRCIEVCEKVYKIDADLKLST